MENMKVVNYRRRNGKDGHVVNGKGNMYKMVDVTLKPREIQVITTYIYKKLETSIISSFCNFKTIFHSAPNLKYPGFKIKSLAGQFLKHF